MPEKKHKITSACKFPHKLNSFFVFFSALQSEVKVALDDLSQLDESAYIPRREATELFRLEEGVQIFFVSPEGRVSTFSEPSRLRVFRFDQQEEGEEWKPVREGIIG